MEDSRLISIIIPVYNRARYLAEAIESVLAQTYRPIEIIVVDDGSTDGTADVARRFSETVRYFYQSNSGCSAARNKGIENTLGSFFSFLDSDDLWVEEKLSRQMAVFDSDENLDMVFGQVSHFYCPDLEQHKREKQLNPTEIMPGYHAGTLLIKRESFLRVGLFDINYELGEFIDWYGKAKEIGMKSVILPEVVMKRRIHSSNSVLNRNAHVGYVRVIKAALDRRRKKND